jgi:hypothetical protein
VVAAVVPGEVPVLDAVGEDGFHLTILHLSRGAAVSTPQG